MRGIRLPAEARHIRRQDVRDLAAMLQGPGLERIEYNIEGYPAPDWVALVKEARPDQATLVPDPPEAHTSDEGWDIRKNRAFLEGTLPHINLSHLSYRKGQASSIRPTGLPFRIISLPN